MNLSLFKELKNIDLDEAVVNNFKLLVCTRDNREFKGKIKNNKFIVEFAKSAINTEDMFIEDVHGIDHIILLDAYDIEIAYFEATEDLIENIKAEVFKYLCLHYQKYGFKRNVINIRYVHKDMCFNTERNSVVFIKKELLTEDIQSITYLSNEKIMIDYKDDAHKEIRKFDFVKIGKVK